MVKRYLSVLIALILFTPIEHAHAAKKQKKQPQKPSPGEIVNESELFKLTVHARLVGQSKKKDVQISCRNQVPGKSTQKSNGIMFTSFDTERDNATWKLNHAKLTDKARTKLRQQIANTRILTRAAKNGCQLAPIPAPAPEPLPGYLALNKYTGPWGEKQVRRLLEVFAFGGKEAWVQPFVQAGMDATLNELFNINKPDQYVTDFVATLSCDPNTEDNYNDCYPTKPGTNINDYYLDGLVSAINLRAIYSLNPVRDKLFAWVMDNRAAVHRRPVGSCNRWMAKDFYSMVDRFTATGDYKQYIADYVLSPLGHGKCLSGDANHAIAPAYEVNEDFGRELVELVMFGPNDRDGNKNYNDYDIIQLSRTLSGLDETSDQGVCSIAYAPGFHFPGATTIFGGTPYQITIGDSSNFTYPGVELAQKLIQVKSKQLAYDLARELWPAFINDSVHPTAFQNLADIIEQNNFNLYPVLRTMAESQAFYAPESAETIVKDPYHFLISFLRMTGMPVVDYSWGSSWFSDLGMRLGDAPTVFGWTYQKDLLTGDVFQLPRVNVVMYSTLWQNSEDLQDKYGWTPYNSLIAPIPRKSGDFVADAVDAMIARLNLTDDVTPAEVAKYRDFVNYYLGYCNQGQPGCFQLNGGWRKLSWDPPNPIDQMDDFYRVRQLLMMLAGKEAFQTM